MNPASERIEESLGRIERAGAGIFSLGNLLSAVEPDVIGENTLSGIGYLLEIVGGQVTEDACTCREAIYSRAASATLSGEAATP